MYAGARYGPEPHRQPPVQISTWMCEVIRIGSVIIKPLLKIIIINYHQHHQAPSNARHSPCRLQTPTFPHIRPHPVVIACKSAEFWVSIYYNNHLLSVHKLKIYASSSEGNGALNCHVIEQYATVCVDDSEWSSLM
jgi:hypothetical protein